MVGDPNEHDDIASQRPELVDRYLGTIERLLTRSREAEPIDPLDDEQLRQLEKLGYTDHRR